MKLCVVESELNKKVTLALQLFIIILMFNYKL